MKPSTRFILGLNVQAVSFMHDQKYTAAAGLLRLAVSELQRYVIEDTTRTKEMVQPVVDERRLYIRAAALEVPKSVCQHEAKTPYFMFHGVIEAVSHPSFDPVDILSCETQRFMLSCILFYNLGLSFHLSGIATGSTDHLERAQMGYQTALGLINERSEDMSVILVELALQNNIGHIHYHLLQRNCAEKCLERMRLIFFDVTNGGEDLVPEPLACFFSNAIYNENLELRAAPVA